MVLGPEVTLMTLATERRRPRPLWRDATAMLVWAAPGALAGVWVLRSLPAVALQVAVTLGVSARWPRGECALRRTSPRGWPGSRRAG